MWSDGTHGVSLMERERHSSLAELEPPRQIALANIFYWCENADIQCAQGDMDAESYFVMLSRSGIELTSVQTSLRTSRLGTHLHQGALALVSTLLQCSRKNPRLPTPVRHRCTGQWPQGGSRATRWRWRWRLPHSRRRQGRSPRRLLRRHLRGRLWTHRSSCWTLTTRRLSARRSPANTVATLTDSSAIGAPDVQRQRK